MNDKINQIQNILVIDDEAEILTAIQKCLEPIALSVIIAENGKKGLELARYHKPTVIISDYFMPGLNGLELLKSLNEEGFKIPMIWLTGYAKADLQKQVWISGVYEVIEKPFDIEKLRQCVLSAASWLPDYNTAAFSGLIKKIASHEIHLSLDLRNYTQLAQICEAKGISITTFVNQLVDKELRKSA